MTSLAGQSVLVTGASGFIGGHLARTLIGRGCRVTCVARPTSQVDALRAAGAVVVACEATDRAGIARVLASSRARAVFHLAGQVRAVSAADFMHANATAVDTLAQACSEQIERPVLVLVSSLAAGGPARERPRVETDPSLPVSDYGRSKLAGEAAALRYADTVPITVLRPCIVFGAADRGLLEVWTPIARAGLHVVAGSGEQRVSLIAVDDLVECLVRAATQGERLVDGIAGRGTYYAAAQEVSHAELGIAMAQALGRSAPRIVHLPAWSLRALGRCGDVTSRLRGRPGWVGRDKVGEMLAGSWTCSSAKARQQLGWAPAAPLADRLRETAAWYRDAHWLS